MNYAAIGLLSLLVLVAVFCAANYYDSATRQARVENWQDYIMKTTGEMDSGSDPHMYKNVPTYRKPYMYPQTGKSEYPQEHERPLMSSH